jgi:hypothetical protein
MKRPSSLLVLASALLRLLSSLQAVAGKLVPGCLLFDQL